MKNLIAKIMVVVVALVLCFGLITFVPTTSSANASETPEKEIDLYFIAGQSNAVGSTKIKGGDGPFYSTCGENIDNTVYENIFYAGQPHRNVLGSSGEVIPFSETNPEYVTQGHGYTRDHIGPELGMAQYLNDKYAGSNKKAAIIKSAAGGTGLLQHWDTPQSIAEIGANWANASLNQRYGTWYPESLWDVKDESGKTVDLWNDYYNDPTGLQYRAFISFVEEQYYLIRAAGYTKINFKALIWMQGCTDRANPTEYQRVFKIFCKDVRTRFTQLSGQDQMGMPVVMGEISETFGSASSIETNKAFIKMQNDAMLTVENLYVINSGRLKINDINADGSNKVLGSDSAHWNYPDMIEIGNLLGETAYKAVVNARRLYMSTKKISSGLGSSPDGKFTTSAYLLEGEDDVTITLTTEKKYKVGDFGVWDGENEESKQSTLSQVQHVCDGTRTYTAVVDVPAQGDLNVYVVYTDANKVTVTANAISTTYGSKPSVLAMENNGNAYESADFTFAVAPNKDGRLKSVSVNGVNVPDVMGLVSVKLANIADYMKNGETSLAIDVDYEKADILSIKNAKKVFLIGEEFSLGDGVVSLESGATGQSSTLSAGDYTVDSSAFLKDRTGAYDIVINRRGAVSTTYKAEVILPTIEVVGMRKGFKVGQEFSSEGAVVQYVDYMGRTIVIDSSKYTITCPSYNKNTIGTYTVNVNLDSSVRANTTSFTVRVVKEATNVTVSGYKSSFIVGEEFELGNIEVVGTVDGSPKTFNVNEYVVNSANFDSSKVGTYDIVLLINGADDYTYQVSVKDKATLSVSGNNTAFVIGQEFSIGENVVVISTDADGNPTTLTRFQYTVDSSNYNKEVAGTYTIVIRANNAHDYEYQVRVKAPGTISISGHKTSFAYKESFSTAGMVVTVTDDDGSKTLSVGEYTVNSSTYNRNIPGTYTIVISAIGATNYTYTVTVREMPTLIVTGQKTQFTLSEYFARGNMVVILDDGENQRELTYGSDYSVDRSQFQKGVAGEYTITVNAEGAQSYTYTVTVGATTPAPSPNAPSSGCAGKAYELMMLVTSLCAVVLVIMKGTK